MVSACCSPARISRRATAALTSACVRVSCAAARSGALRASVAKWKWSVTPKRVSQRVPGCFSLVPCRPISGSSRSWIWTSRRLARAASIARSAATMRGCAASMSSIGRSVRAPAGTSSAGICSTPKTDARAIRAELSCPSASPSATSALDASAWAAKASLCEDSPTASRWARSLDSERLVASRRAATSRLLSASAALVARSSTSAASCRWVASASA